MRIALHSALTNTGRLDEVVAEVRRTAEYGLAGYWAALVAGQDALTVLALAGREAPGIELGTAVVPMPLRPPFALAQQASTVQEAVGGRLRLGIGTSHEAIVTRLGEPWPPPLPTARRYLADLAVAMGRVAHPAPVLLGAVNPAMVALAAAAATGVVTWAAGVRTIREVVLPALAERIDPGPFRVVASLPVCVTDDEAAARAYIDKALGANDRFPSYQKVLRREGASGVAALSLVGSRDAVLRQLDAFEACGVTDFGAHPTVANERDAERTWELLAERAAGSAQDR